MNSSYEPDPETVADALDVLTDVLSWHLAPERWQRVERILGRMSTALAAGDTDGVRAATIDLELASPVRATRIGAGLVEPPPPPVRDRTVHLVHGFGGRSPVPHGGTTGAPERREDGDGRAG